MTMTLEEFAAACRVALTNNPGQAGREQVCALVRVALQDREFVATHLDANGPQRRVLYEDPQLGFTILAHAFRGAKNSSPHDHGPSWAIYGQAAGETVMTDWECLAPPTEAAPGKVRAVREYVMRPGDVHLYEPGAVHSPRRVGSTVLLRIEGKNMDRVPRLNYEAVGEETLRAADR